MTFLPRADVERITKRKKFKAMVRALDKLGCRYRLAADGEPLVYAHALDEQPKPARNSGPRWDRIGTKREAA